MPSMASKYFDGFARYTHDLIGYMHIENRKFQNFYSKIQITFNLMKEKFLTFICASITAGTGGGGRRRLIILILLKINLKLS